MQTDGAGQYGVGESVKTALSGESTLRLDGVELRVTIQR